MLTETRGSPLWRSIWPQGRKQSSGLNGGHGPDHGTNIDRGCQKEAQGDAWDGKRSGFLPSLLPYTWHRGSGMFRSSQILMVSSLTKALCKWEAPTPRDLVYNLNLHFLLAFQGLGLQSLPTPTVCPTIPLSSEASYPVDPWCKRRAESIRSAPAWTTWS